MQIEDEQPPTKTPVPLDRMGVAELEGHIAGLRAEITRAEAEIARKRSLRDAADGVFRRS